MGVRFLIAATCVAGCGDNTVPPPDAPEAGLRWVTTAEVHGTQGAFVTRPLGAAGFQDACPVQPADGVYRFLLGHPTLPYVYGVDGVLEGVALACSSNEITPVPVSAMRSPLSRAVLDPVHGVGFFSADGDVDVGTYRFTVGEVGTPSFDIAADAPPANGPLVLDMPHALYVAGASALRGYALGPGEELLNNGVDMPSPCAQPVDVFVEAGFVVLLCADHAAVSLFVPDPAAPSLVATIALPSVVDVAVALPDGRFAVAYADPPQVTVLQLEPLGFFGGPTFDSRVTAMAASPDGKLVVVARDVSATESELAAYEMRGSSLFFLDRATVPTVTAIAITVPR